MCLLPPGGTERASGIILTVVLSRNKGREVVGMTAHVRVGQKHWGASIPPGTQAAP